MCERAPDGGFFPLVYNELRQLAATKLGHEPAGIRSTRRPWYTKPISVSAVGR